MGASVLLRKVEIWGIRLQGLWALEGPWGLEALSGRTRRSARGGLQEFCLGGGFRPQGGSGPRLPSRLCLVNLSTISLGKTTYTYYKNNGKTIHTYIREKNEHDCTQDTSTMK
jgi:hypothetical protein